ncbi:SPOR domain-containing protein [Asticcacaulis sp. BYS171W]|uniref:SPOR domain-containing protein n=1 Tax=Asticcacaulis aquaticus TaxID=2984212 RepID=A0ABT5I020_9CAUL|nr:SPOR domain-containing protein [Asticcacaulis aquaticus]MDC7685026.1 SPOR domain-containing protein [Asticcacaulis aquaticus]
MRSPPPFSSLLALTICLAATGLSGCDLPRGDGKDFQRMAARLAEIDVDGKGEASSSSSSSEASRDEQIELAFETAKELTTGKDGLVAHAPKMNIRIVNPLDMERPDADTKLDTGLPDATEVAQAEVFAPKPVPVATKTVAVAEAPPVAKAATKTATKALPKNDEPAFKTIQIGSFSSRDGAKAAWAALQARNPGLERFKPVLQAVTTADGKPMVRLRVGPVASPEQAERLCGQLGITDSWCIRAG